MDRRSFLKMFGSSILALFLPKAKAVDDPEQRISEFLTSRECSGSEHWSLREPCEALDPFERSDYALGVDSDQDDYIAWMRYPPVDDRWSMEYPSAEWTFDPVESLVEPHLTFVEALEEIRRVCCDPDLWKMPIEYYTIVMSPEQFDWYYENVPWFASAVDRSEELADDPSTYPSFDEVNAKLIEISGFSLEPPDVSNWCSARLEGVTYVPVNHNGSEDASDV